MFPALVRKSQRDLFFRQVESQVGQVKLKMGIQTHTSATVRIGMHKKNIIGLLFKEEI